MALPESGSNSVAEWQLPKLHVVGSIPISRSTDQGREETRRDEAFLPAVGESPLSGKASSAPDAAAHSPNVRTPFT